MAQGTIIGQDRSRPSASGPGAPDAPGLLVHRSAHPERLVAGLARELSSPLDDPFRTEVVSVPTHGVERWLSQSLASRLGTSTDTGRAGDRATGDGICAGVDFIALHRLLGDAVDTACGVDRRTDPWRPAHAIWALLEIIDECADDPSCDEWFAPLREPFAASSLGAHRWSSADRVLGLFSGYAAERPDLLDAWREGRNTDPDGAPLEPVERWQPELWRRLRQQLAAATAGQGQVALDPAARRSWACDALAERPGLVDLPDRLSVFGPSRLSTAQTQILAALAVHRRVHLWLPQPSPVLWNRIAEARPVPSSRRDDETAALAQNLLNRRLGRDARELQVAVQGLDFVDLPLDTEPSRGAEPTTGSVLARLQRSIELDEPVENFAAELASTDRSIGFHACYGAHRQVEVLREEVLDLLSADPTLEPRDIIVMCPDIEAFAPLLAATFHATDTDEGTLAHPAKRLQIRLADRSLRQLNPLLATLSRLFDLHTSRAGVTDLIDLCADPAVAARFGFREDDHERLVTLAAGAGIRWGIDSEHRGRYSMEKFTDNTWRFGVDRLLLGIATPEDGHWAHGGTVPVDDVDSQDALLIGRLAELVDRVASVLDGFSERHSLTDWIALCRRALESLTATAPTEAWQVSHAWSVLADLGDSEALLDAGDLRALLADAFAGKPTRANFGTGALTICSMMPMRSVPHRVVITLGMDEGSFPRRLGRDGDDLRLANPRTGDRDPRSEDRQVLLDAVLAAREKFVVIYSGASPHTGERRQPCVPVIELRDAITALCSARADQNPSGQGESGNPDRPLDPWKQLERRHSLQPHSPVNFDADDPFSFDPLNHRAAGTHLRPLTDPPNPFAVEILPPLPEFTADVVDVELNDLDKFFKHPVKSFLRRRGNVYLRDDEDDLSNENIVDPNGLELWKVGDRMLRAHLAGSPLPDLKESELRRGDLPPGNLGLHLLTEVARTVVKVAGAASPSLDQPARSLQARVEVGKYRLTGMVGNLRGTGIVEVTFSSLRGSQRLSLWLKLLLLTATRPDQSWTATLVGKGSTRDDTGNWVPCGEVITMGPVNPHEAVGHLNTLLSLYARGMNEPLVMPPNCASQEAAGIDRGRKPNLGPTWKYEKDEAWIKMVGNWDNDLYRRQESNGHSQFSELARLVWGPILRAESRARSEGAR